MLLTKQFSTILNMANRKKNFILLVLSCFLVTISADSSGESDSESDFSDDSSSDEDPVNPSLNRTNIVPHDEQTKFMIQPGGMMGDNVAEVYNFLDGDSFGIGPMHEFVYGWQAILTAMSVNNNAEVRKRAGIQRMALAGLNGISLISHIGVTQIMINGTRTYCFGGVVRPVMKPKITCRGAMYQENRLKCNLPYLRYASPEGHKVCVGELAMVRMETESYTVDGTRITARVPECYLGLSYPKFHYDYICERSIVRVRKINFTNPNEKFNIRNPIVRRVEFYRSEYDILRQCADWLGCNFHIAEEDPREQPNICLLQGNETAFVGYGGQYWLSLYYSKLSSWEKYFQRHSDHPWSRGDSGQGGIWALLMKSNIGPDMNLHYNLNGIYNRYSMTNSANVILNDGQVQPANLRGVWKPDEADDAVIEPFPKYRQVFEQSAEEVKS